MNDNKGDTSTFIIKDTPNPIFKKAEHVSFDKYDLLIKEELCVEDENCKVQEQEPVEILPSMSVKVVNVKIESGNKKKKKKDNRNGKVGVNKDNNFMPSSSTARKVCNNCNSANHLTHSCKFVVAKPITSSMPDFSGLLSSHKPCGVVGCGLCMFNMISNFTMINASTAASTSNVFMPKTTKAKKACPSQVKKGTLNPKPSDTTVKVKNSTVNAEPVTAKKKSIGTHVTVTKPYGPKLVWVPKKA